MKTQPLGRRQYPTKYWTARDLIIAAVNKEAEMMIKDPIREIRPDFRPHKVQFTEVTKRAFAKDIIKFILP